MKKSVLIICLLFVGLMANAQSWNPYVNQCVMSPSPLLPLEFGGEGEASFNIGNTGSSSLVFNRANPDKMILVIKLYNGIPNKRNPLAALQGSWVSGFSWTYDASTTTYTGVQQRRIPGYGQGNITVGYKVTQNTSLSVIANGVTVSIQAPSYASASNTTQDDFVSSFTYVLAKDYGDAPISYGVASHDINIYKTDGLYSKFIHLGRLVDQESEAQSSSIANGDDIDGEDDEDGVRFPRLIAGNTVIIKVAVTVHDESFGILNAWFDWNGDGDFTDSGEKVGEPLPVFSSGIYNLSVSIPETAITTAATFARFRIGNMSGPTGDNSWGEVEDYRVKIRGQNLTNDITLSTSDENEMTQTLGSTNILVYPNPIIDRYSVSISVIGSYQLELVDMLGRILYSGSMEVQSGNGGVKELSRERLPSGPYLLRVTNKKGGQNYTVKLLMGDQ
tara:strand:+ start:1737 stop:3077 length:1341 start_codon:yes stop_codon:yes gene_type:complete